MMRNKRPDTPGPSSLRLRTPDLGTRTSDLRLRTLHLLAACLRLRTLHLLAACLLLLSSCRPFSPTPTPTPPDSHTPTPIPSPTHTPTPPHTHTPTLPDSPTPTPVLPPALRLEFAADLDLFPDATRYEIELTVDLDAVSVAGHERIAYTNTEDVPLDALVLRLFPNTPGYGGEMTVTDARLDGQPVDFAVELEGSALRLPLDPPLAPGEGRDLELDFVVDLPTENDPLSSQAPAVGYRQFGYHDGVLALANAYPLIPVYDDEGWNAELSPPYGDATYSDTALYTVRVTAPDDLTLAASGACTAPTPAPDGALTWTCVAGPMRDFNAILGPEYQVLSQDVEGVTVNSIFYAGHDEGGRRTLDWAAETVRMLTEHVGSYPFTELDVVETPTRAGGIEYPGLVVINTNYYESLNERMEWVVVHEVAHQWWYSLVGNDQVDDPWLDEALTQYTTLLYFERRYGEDVGARLVEQVFQQRYEELVASGRDAPVGLPIAAYSDEDYSPVVYYKGPLYFHALRQEVGDDVYWAILRTYFECQRYDVATPEDWLVAVQAVTGDDHRDLYEKWILPQTER